MSAKSIENVVVGAAGGRPSLLALQELHLPAAVEVGQIGTRPQTVGLLELLGGQVETSHPNRRDEHHAAVGAGDDVSRRGWSGHERVGRVPPAHAAGHVFRRYRPPVAPVALLPKPSGASSNPWPCTRRQSVPHRCDVTGTSRRTSDQRRRSAAERSAQIAMTDGHVTPSPNEESANGPRSVH